jgi:hypothetical protein
MSTRMTTVGRSMLDTDTLQPNTSSCGNQPANISLTLLVETDPPSTKPPHPDRHKMSGPREP